MTFRRDLSRVVTFVTFVFAMFPISEARACDGRVVDEPQILHSPLCVPSSPTRIVVLDATFNFGMALDLGLEIVGAPLSGLQDARLLALAKERKIEDIGTAAEPSVERVVSLAPDLILADGAMHGQVYEIATRVAPTVMIETQDWKEYFRSIASATGKSERADQLLGSYEDRVAAVRARVANRTVSVLRVTAHGLQVYLDGAAAYAPFAVLHDAGVKRSEYETTSGTDFMKRPDWESLAALDGDILFYIVGSAYDIENSGRLEAETLANPLWKTIPAVEAGKAYRVDATTWMAFNGIHSANNVLDDIERYIVDK